MHLAIAMAAMLTAAPSHAQWWGSKAPADFEECVESAEKAAPSKEAKASALAQCDSKFAGRRKPGGGYTYFDFMQNCHFDIAGPNPTADELKKMDEHYTEFLDQRRKSIIAAAFAEKQKQQMQASLVQDNPPPPRRQPKLAQPAKPRSATKPPPARPQRIACRNDVLSCGWSRLSSGLSSIKKTLLGPPPRKTSRG